MSENSPQILETKICVGECGGKSGWLEEILIYQYESSCASDVCSEIGGRWFEEEGNGLVTEMRISKIGKPCFTDSCGVTSTVIDTVRQVD